MRLAVMQPYIFPYVGYFQLIKAVDVFVFFDDVQFKRRSYITRNAILINEESNAFSIPVQKGNQQDLINQIKLHDGEFENWKNKFLRSLNHAYAKAPYFKPVYDLAQAVFETDCTTIGMLTKRSIEKTCDYLKVEVEFKNSTSLDYDREGDGQDKILSICGLLQANTYINAINGRSLYTSETFQEQGVDLFFLEPKVEPYKQFDSGFIPNLSIIEMMMFLSPEEIGKHLEKYKLIN